MTPADRAALAARLRAEGNGLMFDARWSESNGIDAPNERRLGGDLLAAAAELERHRALVEWTAPTGGIVEAHLRGVGMIWSGSVTSAPAHAERWRAAGLDVAEVPS